MKSSTRKNKKTPKIPNIKKIFKNAFKSNSDIKNKCVETMNSSMYKKTLKNQGLKIENETVFLNNCVAQTKKLGSLLNKMLK